MSRISRRKWLIGGVSGVVGVAGAAAAGEAARRHGLMPPDAGLRFGTGAALTYAAQRMLTGQSRAREFRREQISEKPFANPSQMKEEAYTRSREGGFADWQLQVEGMVARPGAIALEELRQIPARSQITQLVCEEGWSYIAEWTGAPLAAVLEQAGVLPEARFVVYSSMEKDWWDSIDMADALHPQTILAHGMNGGALPAEFGGPLRMRVPKQLGYKSVKFINRLLVTDRIEKVGNGLGSSGPDYGYSWYAGI
ncbi:MAG: molybdopterin-dependent oxidoreductase [Bryobacteraceae bacterium]|nr:molybdopterin-dependent oxidoreductase [Solibacteraceae bacterium]MCO5352029.1 molybdopterin-dependent oxidoreductase [Bryobacteraceae bacterium]